jgi:predicted nucleotide-binding protein
MERLRILHEEMQNFDGSKPENYLPKAIEYAQGVLRLLRQLDRLYPQVKRETHAISGPARIFIGHGRSAAWKELKDFLVESLSVHCEEFNQEAVAGMTTTERLEGLLKTSTFAFLVMTAEDRHVDGTIHARSNVIHEIGLFQGRLGRQRAVVLIEEGCTAFSNIEGLSHIAFPPGNIAAIFEDVRQVLEREHATKAARRDV